MARYEYDESNGAWTKTATISTASSLAGLVVLPGGPRATMPDGGDAGDGAAADAAGGQ